MMWRERAEGVVMTLPVFLGHDTRPLLGETRVGMTCTLSGDEGRHAAKVRRMTVGEELDVVDGSGLRVRGVITGTGASSVTLEVRQVIREEAPACRLVLVQALAKGGRDEQAIESATEIGVDAVIPWQSQRSIVKWSGSKADKARAKWESVVVAAAKQSRRSWVPQVEGVRDSRALAQWVARVSAEGGVVFVAHEAASRSMREDLSERAWSVWGSGGQSGVDQCDLPPVVGVIVGPEGGITDEERDVFRQAGAVEVLLGPHVLRSSSAGCAALTLVSAAVGRW